MTPVFRRLDGYRRRLVYEWSQWNARRDARKRRSAFQGWLRQLQNSPPEVLLGANFSSFGGVRGHLQAIQKYSACKIECVPPESLMRELHPYSFTHEFREEFLNFPATGVKVAHSHVYPWFIEWCQEHQKRGLRWIHTYHLNYYPEHGDGINLEPWQREINDAMLNKARFADVCLSVSKWQMKELRDKHEINAIYLPNGVDVAVCDRADAARCHRKTGLSEFVLYVGRNDPVKNPGDFVKLAVSLPQQQFLMFGQGLSNAALHDDWGVSVPTNLKVMGEATHQETQDALAACSALVVTSKREGLPTLVLEAMTHGKPIVVPDEDGCMEAIGHGDFGFSYRHGDIEQLAVTTVDASVDKTRCKYARQRIAAEYDWRVVARKLDQIYEGKN